MVRAGTILLLFLQYITSNAQVRKKVLFIGNSYTYANNLPQMVADIALSKSDTVLFDSNTPGGYTFYAHCNDANSIQKIRSQKWDVVILQGQSQEPSLSPATVMIQTYPFAKQLCDSIRANNACTEIMFYMTWGRKNSDMSYCSTYSPSCTYNGMQARLRESYMLFKDSFMTSVAPIGVAWKTFRNNYPLVDLYSPDESHPSVHGTYLAACVFYSTIFKKTTIGSSYNPSLPLADVTNIQTTASQTVLDSMDLWNLGSNFPKADFSYSLTAALNCQFTNISKNATTFYWSFGSTLKNPTYVFPGYGSYNVVLKSSNQCKDDSVSKLISFTGIDELSNKSDEFTVIYSGHQLKLIPKISNMNYDCTIFTIEGKLLHHENNLLNEKAINLNNLAKGLYLVEVCSANRKYSKKIAIID